MTAPTPPEPALIAEDVAVYDPDPPPRCDHICLKDDGHVERGEPHFYGYENPSPRRQHDPVRDFLFALAADVDMPLKGGSLALPTSDRERRIYQHGISVGLRTAALELEKLETDGQACPTCDQPSAEEMLRNDGGDA